MKDIEKSIVRIFFADTHKPAGVGFLVESDLVVTAAHVVMTALSFSIETSSAPQQTIHLDFPLLQAENRHPLLHATVAVWLPPTNQNSTSDIAILRLLTDKPVNAVIARLVTLSESTDLAIETYGIPNGYDTGVWATGITRRVVDRGRVQLDGVSHAGYFLEPGFSGGCVYCSEVGGVLGMVISADTDRMVRSGQMIPSQYLTEAIRQTLPKFYSIGHVTPPKKQEQLIANLLQVSYFADTIYVAPAKHTSLDKTRDAASEAKLEAIEWLYKGGNVISFHNMEADVWRAICDSGGIEAFNSGEWAYTDDIDKRNEFVWLLNKSLEARIQDELSYHSDKGFYYFKAPQGLETKTFRYFSLQRQTKRDIFVPYGKKQNGQPSYYRHSAFIGHFQRYDNQWYLEITPTYHFTWNGFGMDMFYEERIAKIKQIEKNPAVAGQVIMWARYLAQSGDLFTPDYPFLKFGDLVRFDIGVGINDKVWLTTENQPISDDVDESDDEFPDDFDL